jgi:Zn-dependent peptidase ImmA (M78 family)
MTKVNRHLTYGFDALHELGHLLLHRKMDKKIFRDNILYKTVEDQCHRFASAFLLPRSGFCRELWAPTLDGFMTLKPRWKVSVAAMAKRCEELGILDEPQSRRALTGLNHGYFDSDPTEGLPKLRDQEDKKTSTVIQFASRKSLA